MKNKLSVFDQHRLKIAKRTWYELSDIGALILGGMSKSEAKEVIKELTGKYPKEVNNGRS